MKDDNHDETVKVLDYRTIAVNSIESEELRLRLESHKEFILQQNLKNLIQYSDPDLFFKHHIQDRHAKAFKNDVSNSVLMILFWAFDQLRFSNSFVEEHFAEIPLSDFEAALQIRYYSFGDKFSAIEEGRKSPYLPSTIFYISYILTFTSAKDLLPLLIEVSKMANSGESMSFEKMLKVSKMLTKNEYKEQPIEWTLRIA